MKRLFYFSLALTFLLLLTNVYSAGVEVNGIGARATAMGGNFRSIADDWSAVYWNPAGLAFTTGWSVGTNIGYVLPRASMLTGDSHYFLENGNENYRQFSTSFQDIKDSESINFTLPSYGISYSNGKWAVGIGVAVPMAWGTKWDLLQTDEVFLPNQTRAYNSQYPEYEYETDIQVLDIHPTAALKINEKLSIGAGLSFLYAKVNIRQPVFLQNPFLYSTDIYDFVKAKSDAQQAALLSEMILPPYDHLINQVELSSSGVGFGGNIGIMYKPSETISIGASVQFYSDLNIAGDYKQTTFFSDVPEYDELVDYYDKEIFSKLLEIGGLDSLNYKVVSGFYSGEVESIVDTEADVVLPLPLRAGFGISYSGIDNLVLAFDFNYSQWSVWDVIKINEKGGDKLSQLVQNWNDTFKYGVGFEYTAPFGQMRGGFSYENRASVDASISPTMPDISDRYTLNMGIAVPIGPVDVSLAYERIFMADKEIKEWVYDDLTVTQNIVGLYKIKANTIMLGLDYHF